ncbi:C4BPA protein, partial [Bucco capensis]|nr:C4BPA protein [Bucco capensis]
AMRWLCVLLLALPGARSECEAPPRFAFAEPPLPLQPSYPVGSTLRYRCRPGYTQNKSPVVTCNPNSTWSAQPNFCIGKSCGPPQLENGNFDFTTNLLFGATVTFMCKPGYRLVGKSTATCVIRDNGVAWDNIPYCEIIPCLPPPKIDNGHVPDGDFTFGMSVTYSCAPGLALIGEATIHCTTEDNLQGVWSGPAPECKVVSCPNPDVPNGRRLSGFGTAHTYKDTVSFGCNAGYSLSGSAVVTCEADSTWKPAVPTCDQIYCGPAPHIPYAELSTAPADRYPAGTKLSYHCNPGYSAAQGKSSVVTCLDDTTWAADPDFCVELQCTPLTIRNGDVIADNFLFGTVVTFTCHQGYELKGSSSTRCVVSGNGVNWDPAPPSCERHLPDVPCEEPPSIANGMHNGTKGTAFGQGSVVVYQCKDGFTLAGAAFLQCIAGDQYQGAWSKPPPECRGGANILLAGLFPLLLAMLIMNI